MLSFKQFIKEYLTPDEKDVVATWPKRTEMATKATDHFFGVGNEDHEEELFNPNAKSEVHRAIEHHLGISIPKEDYNKGVTIHQNKRVRLGSAIKDEGLRNAFKSDNTRQARKHSGLIVHTTRSAIGVAGQTSHGQSWEDHSCKNFNTGLHKDSLPHEVEHGTVVSYLKDKDGNELARASFQPYINDEGHTCYSQDSYYGVENGDFRRKCSEIENKLSGEHKGGSIEYRLHPKVYNNRISSRILHPEVVKKLVADPDTNSELLKKMAKMSNDPDVHRAIAKHEKANDTTLSAVANKSDDPEVHRAILNHKNASDQIKKLSQYKLDSLTK